MTIVNSKRGLVAAEYPNGAPVNIVAITPDDTNDLAREIRCLWVGVTGNVKIRTPGGQEVTLPAVAAGGWHPIRAQKVFATGTTATTILGGY